MSNNTTVNKVTMSFPILAMLGIVFVTLKLCGVIGWSWWLVTLPFWGLTAGVIAVVVVVFILGAFFKGIAMGIDASQRRKREKDIAKQALAKLQRSQRGGAMKDQTKMI